MCTHDSSEEPRHLRIIDEERNCYRDYYFLDDSNDIDNKIFQHIMYFGQNTKFHDHQDILKIFTSLCHKVNVVKYHLKKYKTVELELESQLSALEKLIDHDGIVLIEKVELTAEYESFLMQVKATLDVLVKFLNIVYSEGNKNPLKFQSTFGNGGKAVIKSLEKYIKIHPEQKENIIELLNYLKTECSEVKDDDPNSFNWIINTINSRDTVSHFRKHEYFAFQISYVGEEKIIIPPKLTKNQTMLELLEIVYENLLIFIQDFLALLFIPYLEKPLKAYTYGKEEVVDIAPKWYLQLGDFPPSLIWQNMSNLSIIKKLCEKNKGRLTPDYCEKMYLHYASFYKKKGSVITSKGIEDHERNQIIKFAEQGA
jgi:hypothetical protein